MSKTTKYRDQGVYLSAFGKNLVSSDLSPSLDQKSRLIVFPRDVPIPINIAQAKGVQKVGAGLFIAQSNTQVLRDSLGSIPQIRFKKARDIPKGDARKMKPFAERTYAIVRYSFRGVTPQQKKRVQRLFFQAPCIRLRPGVILFPYLRSRQRSRYYVMKDGTTLMDSKTFASETSRIGVPISRWSRLKLTNEDAEQYIHQSFKKTVETDLGALEKKLKILLERLGKGEDDLRKLKNESNNLVAQHKKMKRNLEVLKAVWEYDANKDLKRTYNMILRVQRKLREKE